MRRGALSAALGVALVLVVILARQLGAWRARYDDLNRRFQAPHAGMYVPTFEAVTLAGDTVKVGSAANGDRQLLFFLTTTCPYCIQSLRSWRELAGAAQSLNGVAVFGVSLDSLRQTRLYAERHKLAFPVLLFPEPKLAFIYRAQRVPVTMVLDSAGRVLYSRVGLFEGHSSVDSMLAVLASGARREVASSVDPSPLRQRRVP